MIKQKEETKALKKAEQTAAELQDQLEAQKAIIAGLNEQLVDLQSSNHKSETINSEQQEEFFEAERMVHMKSIKDLEQRLQDQLKLQ